MLDVHSTLALGRSGLRFSGTKSANNYWAACQSTSTARRSQA